MKIMLANIGKIVNVMGGRQKVFCNMANALAAKGYDVSCLYMDEIDGKPYFPLDSSVKCYNLLHLKIPQTYIYPPRFPLYKKALREILRPFISNMAREMKENHIGSAIAGNLQKILKREAPDVVVSYAPLTTKYLMKDGLCKAPVITMIHEEPSDNLAAATRQVKQCLDECAAIQLLLEYGKSIVRRDIAKAPVFIIGNVVPQYDEKIEYESKSKYTIVDVASLDKINKRQHILLEAFALLKDKYPDWQVELWGPGNDGKYAAELKRIIAKHNLQDKVKICGATDDVKSVLLRSDIFAFPSRTEAFSLALGEAMSAGLPVVGMSVCRAVKVLLQDGKIGLLSEDSVEDFSRKLTMLMDNAELRRHYGEAGRAAMKQYAEEKIWDQWDLLIKKVAARDKA